jgi:hypothetical protein
MSNPTSNFNWQMPTATDLVTDLPADFEVFGQAVDTSLADLKGGTSGQILAKNTNADMDFVWVTNDVGDITAVTAGTGISGGGTSGAVTITNSMATEITAKGDLIVGTGNAAFDNLPAGTNGHVLTADSTVSPTGLKWAAGGKFAQIVYADNTGQTTITSTSFVTSNLTATITPSATSSKVLIQVNIPFYGPGGGQQMDLAIFRGTVGSGTNLSPSHSLLWGTRAEIQTGSMLFLDSPATSSAQVYTVAAKVAGGTGYTINNASRGVITLTEVLA